MKKLFAMLLAVIMIFSLATVSFASEDVEAPVYEDMSTVTVTKTYSATNAGTTSPAETFSFSALTCTSVTDAAEGVTAANAPVPTIGSVAYTAGEAGSETMTKDITINLPEYTSVGIYTYTFAEVVGDTAGVTYHADDITLKVTVIQGADGKIRVAAVHTESAGEKSDDFENVYSAGSLAVSKTVTGNLGDQSKDFTVKVTFTAPEGKTVKEAVSYIVDGETLTIAPSAWVNGVATVDIALKHGETITFTNIPYGVSYTVVENDYTGEGYDAAKYSISDEAKVIDSAADTVGITNNKTTDVDTGVVMDSIPYILILAVAAFGIVAIMSKKRYEA